MTDKTAIRTLRTTPRETTHARLQRRGVALHRIDYEANGVERTAWVYATGPVAAVAILRARVGKLDLVAIDAQADDSGLRAALRPVLVIWPDLARG